MTRKHREFEEHDDYEEYGWWDDSPKLNSSDIQEIRPKPGKKRLKYKRRVKPDHKKW